METEGLTVSELLDQLDSKLQALNDKGAALVKTFLEQADAADKLAESTKSAASAISAITGSIGDPNNNPWDFYAKTDDALVNQLNGAARKSQAAIDSASQSGNYQILDNTINGFEDFIAATYKNIILPAQEQLAIAQAQGNTAKAKEIQRSIGANEILMEDYNRQIDRLKSVMEKAGVNTKHQYRLEIAGVSGKKSYIETDTYEEYLKLVAMLGSSARLV